MPMVPKVNWGQITLDPESIDKMEVRVEGIERPNIVIFRLTPIEFTTTRPSALRRLAEGLRSNYALRYAQPDIGTSGGGWGGAGRRFALITIILKDGPPVTVSASLAAFGIGDKNVDMQNAFHSWILAKLLDDLYFENTGEHIPKQHFERLSGEEWLESSRKVYAQLVEDT